MSAKNWRKCPKCVAAAEAERRKKLERAERAYGKVPSARYLRLAEDAERPAELKETMREDYEIGVDERGTFHVRYSCDCQECGFGYTYRHEARATPAIAAVRE